MRKVKYLLLRLKLLIIGIWNFLLRGMNWVRKEWKELGRVSQSEVIEGSDRESIAISQLKKIEGENEWLKKIVEEEREDRREMQEILFEKLGVIAREKEE